MKDKIIKLEPETTSLENVAERVNEIIEILNTMQGRTNFKYIKRQLEIEGHK